MNTSFQRRLTSGLVAACGLLASTPAADRVAAAEQPGAEMGGSEAARYGATVPEAHGVFGTRRGAPKPNRFSAPDWPAPGLLASRPERDARKGTIVGMTPVPNCSTRAADTTSALCRNC